MRRLLIAAVLLAVMPVVAVESPARESAQRELYSAHWAHAAELYREILSEDPGWGPGWDGLVRALIEAHKSGDAYEAASQAMKAAPESAGAYTAQGRALFRQGRIGRAETAFRKAERLDPRNAYALDGIARCVFTVAKFKSAEALEAMAYRLAPEDPDMILGWAYPLKGEEHVQALRRALSIYAPDTIEAKRLRAHVAADAAIGERHTRTLGSPYQPYDLKLVNLLAGPGTPRGVGLRVRFNDSRETTLMLDTGAGGISLSPKTAAKAGLEALEEEGVDVRGVGDQKMPDSFEHLAREVRIGDLVLHDYPVSVFKAAKDSAYDGLIGADVFSKFLVQLDWPDMKLRLLPYPGLSAPPEDTLDSDERVASGFQRIFRLGHLLFIPTMINDGPTGLFLIDSGASGNLVNVAAARGTTTIRGDPQAQIRGVQGRVERVSRADRVRLTFANFRQDNADLVALDLTRQSDDMGIEVGGVLGMPVLRRLVLTIDYRNAAVRPERGKP